MTLFTGPVVKEYVSRLLAVPLLFLPSSSSFVVVLGCQRDE